MLPTFKENDIWVSSITPCFKMQKYLKKFLEEVPKQTIFNNLQIVLDHNEPTPEELVWVKEFQEKYPGRLKHIITDPVEPIGVSMNTCIKEADGHYVSIWNVDDLRTPNSFEKQLEPIKTHLEAGLEAPRVVHGNFIIVNEFGATKGKYVDHSHTMENPKELERGMCIGPFFLFDKKLVDEVGYFDEQLRSGADFDLAIRLAKRSYVSMGNGILGYYLDEGLGASTRGDGLQQMEREIIYARHGVDDKINHGILKHALTKNYKVNKIVSLGEEHDV